MLGCTGWKCHQVRRRKARFTAFCLIEKPGVSNSLPGTRVPGWCSPGRSGPRAVCGPRCPSPAWAAVRRGYVLQLARRCEPVELRDVVLLHAPVELTRTAPIPGLLDLPHPPQAELVLPRRRRHRHGQRHSARGSDREGRKGSSARGTGCCNCLGGGQQRAWARRAT